MATLAADKPRRYENFPGHPHYNEIPIIADDIVYLGAAVGESTTAGTGRPLVGGDTFKGFCTQKCDNAGGAAAALNIKLLAQGEIVLVVTGVDNINDEGATVYASDDDTFSLTSTSTSTAIGKVLRLDNVAANKAVVFFQADYVRSL